MSRDEAEAAGLNVTHWVYQSVQRGKEIKTWLDKHPETEAFVVFDDDSDMDDVKDFFVQVEGDDEIEGLKPHHIEKAMVILEGQNNVKK